MLDPSYYIDYQREATEQERKHALAKLCELTEKAKEIEASVLEKKKALANEFMEFVENGGLRPFDYDQGINGAVYDFVETARLDEYSSDYEFWLPSNIGC